MPARWRLADGYFVIPYTIGDDLAGRLGEKLSAETDAFAAAEAAARGRIARLLAAKGERSVDSFHRELGRIVWDHCGISRTAEGLRAGREKVAALRDEYWRNVRIQGSGEELNQELERAGRVADYFELADLMCLDALERDESCGGHFREEHQTPEGEALRDDERYTYVAAWEWMGEGKAPGLHKEPLRFEFVEPSRRSYT